MSEPFESVQVSNPFETLRGLPASGRQLEQTICELLSHMRTVVSICGTFQLQALDWCM